VKQKTEYRKLNTENGLKWIFLKYIKFKTILPYSIAVQVLLRLETGGITPLLTAALCSKNKLKLERVYSNDRK